MSISHERISRLVIDRADLTGSASARRDELVKHVGEAVEIRQLARGGRIAPLAQAIDPYARDPQLVCGHDVVEVALGHVDVVVTVGARLLVERLPVAMAGLV